jgi:SM-20-related protein
VAADDRLFSEPPQGLPGPQGLQGLQADLSLSGIAVRDRFLSQSQVNALIRCARARRERGEFVPARVGAQRQALRRAEIRGDSICWLAEPLLPPERELLGALEQVRLMLNREAFLGLFDLEMHYAWYPPGAGYARHIDQPRGSGQRRVSLVLYLNRHWGARDGGELMIVDDLGRDRRIEPAAGRLAVFLTAGREHEVMQTRRDRLSLTGWFRGRE